ncbi:MAG: sigma-70 family RNA polymerase sigma factor [Chitinophagaceae bacterium]|nr:sigma-70 family RNA polymerase sigma factor [Chitinophagaceae bacterium]
MTALPEPKQWVEKYADYLYSYALARLDNEETARDLVQETFLAALEKLGQFKGESSERTWLTAILKYKVIDVYRKRSSGLQSERIGHEPEIEFFEPENGHWKDAYAPRALGVEDTDLLAHKELAAILRMCLQKLPALWHSVFSMKHMEEMETDAICKEIKVTPSNFWVIIHRAKLNLRACIQKAWK